MENERTVELFNHLISRKDVAHLLGTTDRQLIKLLYVQKTENYYREYKIPKRNGGYRAISAPSKKLLHLQRKLLHVLENVYEPRRPVYGFVKGRSHVDNAKTHYKQKLVLNIDLKDFFQQIHFGRVMGMFKAKPYCVGNEAAMVLAQIACYNRRLPQGAPTSPIISNMVCGSLDTKMMRLAKKHNLVYSRYCDDITLSTNKKSFPEAIASIEHGKVIIGNELEKVLSDSNFIVNEDKVYLRDSHHRQEVTGVVVNCFPNLKREYLRELRTILYACEKHGSFATAKKYIELKKTSDPHIIALAGKTFANKKKQEEQEKEITQWFSRVLKGKIEYIRCVRGDDCKYFLKYGKVYDILFETDTFHIKDFKYKKDNYCFCLEAENGENILQGSAFLLQGYGIVTNAHVIDNEYIIYKVICGGVRKKQIMTFTSDSDSLLINNELDYAVYSVMKEEGWELGDSDDIQQGSKVKILSFPDYAPGDSITITECRVTGRKKSFLPDLIWGIDKNIYHGSSGGVVLNEADKVVGIVESGVNTSDFEKNEGQGFIPGFIPINWVINDLIK